MGKVHSYSLKAKPELGIQFEASGDTVTEALESTGTSDRSKVDSLVNPSSTPMWSG